MLHNRSNNIYMCIPYVCIVILSVSINSNIVLVLVISIDIGYSSQAIWL